MGIFSKINFGLTKTRNKMAGAIDDLLDSVGEINDDLYTELEELLVMHDVGVQTSLEIIEELRKRVPEKKIKNPTMVKDEIKEDCRRKAIRRRGYGAYNHTVHHICNRRQRRR